MNWLIKNFLRGLVIVVPIALTIYLAVVAFLRLDSMLNLETRGLGLLIIVAGCILIGALASSFVLRRALRLTDALFTRAPLVRLIYSSVKDLLEAFVGDKKRFDRPVAVSLAGDASVRTLGFVTQDDLAFLGFPGHMAVYLPFSYSMAGTVILVPSSRVERLEVESASVMALIVSGGISRAASGASS